ncbi:HAD family hydrolase [Staphylococcus gallinarum]|uniref:HAD family hydrolase n=1 Tax=Staphylococcus gallinarum TaxID=1293 RepID=UPI001E45583F|nr:HAD family hydrolase [Staphylococcus gallinarum]MCD8786517.1 HAD family hydrolase [Staphylococcus gallinarum]MCD8859439.1 HAD family hydrolase [Staphylococcus gallinarum]
MIKAILFDLDGTILDRKSSLINFIDYQYNKFNNYLNHINQTTFKNKFLELDRNGYVWKDKVYTQLIDIFNITGLSADVLLDDYINNFCNQCLPYPNLKETLDILKSNRYKLGIITNGKYPFQYYNIKSLQIEEYMDVILVSEKENIKKPNPLIFERAAKKLNIDLCECLFVGDSYKNDYIASKSAGMYSIYRLNNENKIYTTTNYIKSLSDLTDIVTKSNDLL